MTKRSEDAWYAVGDEVRTYRGTLLTVNEWLTDEDAEEVCRMAAAAPMMLRALMDAKEELYYMAHSGCDPDSPESMDSVSCAYRACRDAIKAARGEDYDE